VTVPFLCPPAPPWPPGPPAPHEARKVGATEPRPRFRNRECFRVHTSPGRAVASANSSGRHRASSGPVFSRSRPPDRSQKQGPLECNIPFLDGRVHRRFGHLTTNRKEKTSNQPNPCRFRFFKTVSAWSKRPSNLEEHFSSFRRAEHREAEGRDGADGGSFNALELFGLRSTVKSRSRASRFTGTIKPTKAGKSMVLSEPR